MSTTHDKVVTTAASLVLPWENQEEYHALLHELTETHRPQGATERFLIEELAALMWRKRRIPLAEAASFRDGLKDVTMRVYGSESVAKSALVAHVRKVKTTNDAVQDALLLTDQETEHELSAMHNVEKKVQKALRLLRDRKPHAYERARKALPSGTCEWWEETLEIESDDAWDENDEENDYQATPDSLAEFLETQVLPWAEQRITELPTAMRFAYKRSVKR